MSYDPKSVALGYIIRDAMDDNVQERFATPQEAATMLGIVVKGSLKIALLVALAAIALVLPFAILLALIGWLFGGGTP